MLAAGLAALVETAACLQDLGVFVGGSLVADASQEDSARPIVPDATVEEPPDSGADAPAPPCITAPQACLNQRTTCRSACDTSALDCQGVCADGGGVDAGDAGDAGPPPTCSQLCLQQYQGCNGTCNLACITCSGSCSTGCL
jgi:hypothetical protein